METGVIGLVRYVNAEVFCWSPFRGADNFKLNSYFCSAKGLRVTNFYILLIHSIELYWGGVCVYIYACIFHSKCPLP